MSLRVFQASVIVYGIILSVILGINSLREQQTINWIDSQREANCAYQAQFVLIFNTWTDQFATAKPNATQSSLSKRTEAFDKLKRDLTRLGTKTCGN